jgi:hypothetical protein
LLLVQEGVKPPFLELGAIEKKFQALLVRRLGRQSRTHCEGSKRQEGVKPPFLELAQIGATEE